jgi:hypothetical protein
VFLSFRFAFKRIGILALLSLREKDREIEHEKKLNKKDFSPFTVFLAFSSPHLIFYPLYSSYIFSPNYVSVTLFCKENLSLKHKIT